MNHTTIYNVSTRRPAARVTTTTCRKCHHDDLPHVSPRRPAARVTTTTCRTCHHDDLPHVSPRRPAARVTTTTCRTCHHDDLPHVSPRRPAARVTNLRGESRHVSHQKSFTALKQTITTYRICMVQSFSGPYARTHARTHTDTPICHCQNIIVHMLVKTRPPVIWTGKNEYGRVVMWVDGWWNKKSLPKP